MKEQEEIQALAKMIDHSLLHPTMTETDLRNGCEIAKKYHVASVCIKPYAISLAVSALEGSDVAVGTVIGFPHGSPTLACKKYETEEAIKAGATEIDMVINIGKALEGDWDYIFEEIETLNSICEQQGALLKVIFENDLLPSDDIKIKLCEICNEIGVAFVKTSTGYGFVKGPDGKYSYNGATTHDLKLMRKHSKTTVQVKAAGGVRTLADIRHVRSLGVTRVGATATIAILEAARKEYGLETGGASPIAKDESGY